MLMKYSAINDLFQHKQLNFNTSILIYVSVKKYEMNASYFGETPEETGQAEDYRLKLSPRKARQQY
ncbi:hypothetical protein MXL52_11605 [Staphylococcus gallinarum]|uniref:hypothetical protein n=1 Tax=Staphylococcus gallinarum TaxID=1293 RepID=UPI002DBA8CF5|nr:hypothetical protein [Staphylococcus gallinarum]MEB6238503.1 hypothetical protein [Staphylococcus gallinarum]